MIKWIKRKASRTSHERHHSTSIGKGNVEQPIKSKRCLYIYIQFSQNKLD
jgi:hypothetical protein